MHIDGERKVLLDAYYETNRIGVWVMNDKDGLLYSSFPYAELFCRSGLLPCEVTEERGRQGVFLSAGDNELYCAFSFSEQEMERKVYIGPVFFSRPQALKDFEGLSFHRVFPHTVTREICDAVPVVGLMNFVSVSRFLMLAFSQTAPERSEMEEQLHLLASGCGQYGPAQDTGTKEEDCGNTYRTEKLLLNHVRNGDVEKVKTLLSGTKKVRTGKMSDDAVTQRLFDMVCSTTLVTRAALQGGLDPETAFALSDYYIQKASRFGRLADLTMLSHQMLLDFTQCMSRLQERRAKYSLPVQKCIDYIFLHFHEKITTAQLARQVYLSASHLSRIFKSETGAAIQEFIQEVRIREAKEMLLTTDYRYSTISSLLNFSSQSYFISVFKARTGITPKEYRRRHGQGAEEKTSL